MFSEKELRELVDYHAPSAMLSIYLNTDPSLGNTDSYRLRLRNMLKTVDQNADVERIEQFFDTEYDWSGKSVSIFSNMENDFFRVYPLAVPVQDLINIGTRPNVRPLAALLDSYGGYGVVLIDKQGARLFHFHLGEVKEQEGILGETIRQTKGGGSALPGKRSGAAQPARAVEETVERNMRDSVEFAIKFFEEKHIRRILLSGSDDNIALFRTYLPKAWQSLVVGSFPAAMTASQTEVYQRAMEIGMRAERNREQLLMERLITQAAKKSGAVVGLESTLEMLHEGRIQTLVTHAGYQASGFRCADCNTITTLPEENCKNCSQTLQPVQDVVALAVSTIMEGGGEVEVVLDNPELERAGQVGAFLRY